MGSFKNLFKAQKSSPLDQALGAFIVAAFGAAMFVAITLAYETMDHTLILDVGAAGWYSIAVGTTIFIAMYLMLETVKQANNWYMMRKAHKAGKVLIEIDGQDYTDKPIPSEILHKALAQLNEKPNGSV